MCKSGCIGIPAHLLVSPCLEQVQIKVSILKFVRLISNKELFVNSKVPDNMYQEVILNHSNRQTYICFNDMKFNLDPSNSVRYVLGPYFD